MKRITEEPLESKGTRIMSKTEWAKFKKAAGAKGTNPALRELAIKFMNGEIKL